MKTYEDYVKEYKNSTESQTYSFEGWLMLLIDKRDKRLAECIQKACEVLHKTGAFELMAAQEGMSAACMEDQFRKTMEELL